MVALSAGKGIASFCRRAGIASEAGQNNCSPWFYPFCRAKACVQRSLSADLSFGSFCQEKEQSQPAAIERANVC